MRLKNISFPSDLSDIEDITNNNIDVFVELEDDFDYNTYTVVVATAKNIEYLMDKEKKNYFGSTHPFIIVKKLTREIVTEALKAYASDFDGYWLKLSHFAEAMDETVFNQLQAEHLKELDKIDNS